MLGLKGSAEPAGQKGHGLCSTLTRILSGEERMVQSTNLFGGRWLGAPDSRAPNSTS